MPSKNIIEGIGSVVDIWGCGNLTQRRLESFGIAKNDCEAIKSDWMVVGEDIWSVGISIRIDLPCINFV